MPNSDSIGELFLVIKKKNEELEVLNKDLTIKNNDLKDRVAFLEGENELLAQKLKNALNHR